MKKLDALLVKAFIGPFLVTFFISLFVLLMQFLWKYIEDLVGKGLDGIIIAELLFYASANLVPLALPLAVLLASIMTYGNLGEHYELVAIKSSGISLFRAMMPLIAVILFVSSLAFYFSSYLLPIANVKYYTLLYSITRAKPALNFKENVFNSDIDKYSIKIGYVAPDKQNIGDILIYDHSSNMGNDKVIYAQRGKITSDASEKFLVFKLYEGYIYEEQEPNSKIDPKRVQNRTYFEEYEKIFDPDNDFEKTDEGFIKDYYKTKNIEQLRNEIDTLNAMNYADGKYISERIRRQFSFMIDTTGVPSADVAAKYQDLYEAGSIKKMVLANTKGEAIIIRAANSARNVDTHASMARAKEDTRKRDLIKSKIWYQQKFTLSIACLVLFFIGAPFGAIIRKGGLGAPMVFSIIFFIIFHLLNTMGDSMADQEKVSPFIGMWMAIFILFPVGCFLTYKAMNDSQLFDMDYYMGKLKGIFKFVRRKPV